MSDEEAVTPADPGRVTESDSSSSDSGATVATAIAPVAVPADLHGVVSPYNGNQEEWVEYAERLENYFITNEIADVVKRKAILLNSVGAPTYRLIKRLTLPGMPKDLTFEEIVDRVRNHFNPKPSPIIKQFEFNTRKHRKGRR